MPTIDENIAELQQKTTDLITAHTNIKNAIIAKGGTVNDGDKFSDYPEDIETIKNDLTSISINENGTYKNGTLDTVTGTEYPIEIVANGEPIVSMTVNGNAVQDGTPTPTAPVDVVGVGIKSGNLCPMIFSHTGVVDDNGTAGSYDTRLWSDKIPVAESQSYYVVIDGAASNDEELSFNRIIQYDANGVFISRINVVNSTSTEFTTSANCRYVVLDIRTPTLTVNISVSDINTIMLNEGESPLPYEPYGYYLPTTINGGNNIDAYFGNYQTTRKIKKLVLTGEETVNIHPTIASWFQIYLDNDIVIDNLELCTHYKPSPFTAATIQNGEILVVKQTSFDTGRIIIRDTTYSTAESFKTYLQQQYAAGTPVTVWYVLDTPQTTTSGEPLMKLGDYADQLTLTDSDITLPTVTGNNLIDYDLTVKPSSASISYYKLGVSKTITSDTLPIEFESTGDPLTSYSITGQTVQNGTPAPSSPVAVNGTGDKTGNLFDKDRTQGIIADVYINQSGEQISSQNYYLSYPIEVLENSVYTWSFVTLTSAVHSAPTVAFYDINDELLSVATHNSNIKHFTFTTPPNAKYIRGSVYKGYSQNTTMFLEGGTQIADTMSMNYIPYGYKIPISSNDTTTPVYLGEVQTTRRIKKLVLTGNENVTYDSERQQFSFVADRIGGEGVPYCTHYKGTQIDTWNNLTNGYISFHPSDKRYWRICDTSITSSDAYKTYLQQQYAAGTPVTIWYVLAEPTTGIVNEPLMRIGDYADTLSSVQAQVQIPTTVGHNTFNVNTTVKPSSTSITYNDLNTIGYNEINVDVPNTYTVEDEGKVVNSGTLVAQTAMPTEITANDTYDTTLYNSIVVNVPTGGSTGTKNDVTFYDYDGTIVQSYSAADFANLSELPANPSHEGLTSQGWNWSLADAKTYVAENNRLDIGQMYTTSDGNTRLHIRLGDGRLKPYLGLTGNSSGTTVSIDWGDGSTSESVTLNTSTVYTPHEYSIGGEYTISITVDTGSITLTGNSSTYANILRKSSAPNGNNDRVYQNSLISIEIGNNVSIGQHAFNACSSLSSINIPDGVTSIGNYAFNACYSLSSITIPDSVTSIGTQAFQSCASLTSITIPDTVTSIATDTFNGCQSLTSITISNGVITIGGNAFRNCYSLTSITVPDSVTSIGTYTFYSCYSLSSITIPDSVTSIDTAAFSFCYSLQSITVPNRVTSIASNAFQNCFSLTSITVPDSVTSIGTYAFQYCYGLGSIKFTSTTPPTVSNSNAWTGVPTDCTILVPINTFAAYTTATNYPNPSSYTYLVYSTYESGVTLPSSTTDRCILTWYASIADAKAETNPITTGNGNEIYARCVIDTSVTRTTDFVNNTTSLDGDVSQLLVYSNMKRCNVADDGTINAYDGDAGYTEDGSNGQVMVYVRKFYYKLDVSEEGSLSGVNIRKGKWSISDIPKTGFKLHPAFIGTDGTTELDYFLYGAFEAVGQDNNGTYSFNYNTTSYKMGSVGGNAYEPIGNLERYTARTMAANRGTGWYQAAVRQTMAVQMLFAVEYGFNSQLTLGQGFTDSSNSNPIKTGTTTGSTSSGSTTNAKIAVSYRGIENMWGNKWAWIDGLNISSRTPYICKSYSFTDDTTTGYTKLAFGCPSYNNYQSALGYDSTNDWVLLPSEASGADQNSAIGDYVYTSTGNLAALLGGTWNVLSTAGLFDWYLNGAASTRARDVGARLMYIPS